MSEFQRFQAEQERLQEKINAAIAAQRKRERRRSDVTGMDLLKFFGKVILGALVLYGFALLRGM